MALHQISKDERLRPIIAVDFDGTLCDHEYPNIGKIKPGAKEALDLFRALGYTIMIWTCRTCHFNYDVFGGDPTQPTLERTRVLEMKDFLKLHDIPYDIIDDGSKGKPGADYYIDDKAIRFQNNWAEIAYSIHDQLYRTKAEEQNKLNQQRQAALNQMLQAANGQPAKG